jgi:hypothetical protein
VTIPTTPHVIYTIAGAGPDVSGQTLTEPVGTTVSVVATPATGYQFSGPQSVTNTVTLTNPGDCNVDVTPVVPTISQLECTGPNLHSTSWLTVPITEGVIYQVKGKDVSGTISETGATTVVVTAIPATGYEFATGATTSWSEDFTDTGVCLAQTHAATPSFTNDTCTAANDSKTASYTIPSSENVSYTVNGVPVEAGTFADTNGAKITITAIADTGYELTNTVSSWTHTFTETPVCHSTDSETVHQAPVTTPTTTGLASTGVPTQSLLIDGVLIVLLGLGLLRAGGSRGRKNRA